MRNGHKFNAVKTVIDGITFASKAEARRYAELKLMEKAGEIRELELQPRFPLLVDGVNVATYVADFRYWRRGMCTIPIIEDVKGVKTPVFRLKAKMFTAQYGIEITEIGRQRQPVTKAKRAVTTRRSAAK